jgi:Flp pilus assembly protein CpaB
MANQKSTTLIALGVAVFVIGGALLFLVVRHNDKKTKSPAAAASKVSSVTTTLAPGTRVFPATTPTTIIQFKIPSGENAVAVQMSYFPGGGGYVQDGDSVNVYAVAKPVTAASGNSQAAGCSTATSGSVVLIQSNLKVLSVIGQAPAQIGQPTSFLLAATPGVAAQLIYQQTFESLYFTLTTPGQAPAAPLAITCTNAF